MSRSWLPVTIAATCLCAMPAPGADRSPLTPEQLAVDSVRVAVVQMTGTWIWQGTDDAPQDTVEQVLAYIERAGEEHAGLVAFPELLLGKFRVPNRSTRRIAEAAAQHPPHPPERGIPVRHSLGEGGSASRPARQGRPGHP